MRRVFLPAIMGALILLLAGCGGFGLPATDFTQSDAENLLTMTADSAAGMEAYGHIAPTGSPDRDSESLSRLTEAQAYLSLFRDPGRAATGTWAGPDPSGWWTWTEADGPIMVKVRYFAAVYRYEYVITSTLTLEDPSDTGVIAVTGFSVFNEDPLLYPAYVRTGEIGLMGEEFTNGVSQGVLGFRLAWQEATIDDLTSVPGYLVEKVLTGIIQLYATNTSIGLNNFLAMDLTTNLTGLAVNLPVLNYDGTVYEPAGGSSIYSGSQPLYEEI